MSRGGETFGVLIVEDEAPARRTLRDLLTRQPEVEILGECWGEEAVDRIRETDPDILLLDVRMPRIDGFEVLRRLEPDTEADLPIVVFVTAHEEHALEAFEVRAIDYLLKPFTDERFRQALGRAEAQVRQRRRGVEEQRLLPLGRLGTPVADAGTLLPGHRVVLQDGGTTLVLPHDELRWIEASGPYVVLHTPEREHLVRASLTALEERLADRGFLRVHRSALVNLAEVREVRPLSHGDALAVLADGTRVRVSRSRREELEARLQQADG